MIGGLSREEIRQMYESSDLSKEVGDCISVSVLLLLFLLVWWWWQLVRVCPYAWKYFLLVLTS
jgi:hypothetical protein